MALTKEVSIDRVEIVDGGCIQVRQVTKIVEDGNVLSQSFHRWSLTPGQDLTGQPDNIKSIAEAAWTPEVITAYQAQQEAIKQLLG